MHPSTTRKSCCWTTYVDGARSRLPQLTQFATIRKVVDFANQLKFTCYSRCELHICRLIGANIALKQYLNVLCYLVTSTKCSE